MTVTPEKTTGASKRDILALCKEHGVSFLRLQFTDILGINKNFEVPESQFAKALEGDIRFDGSAIEGFVRIEESDMVLKPDLDTFRILPYDDEGGRVARLLCDIYNPDGSPFAGCPRQALKRQIARAAALKYDVMVGVEAEFYIFQLGADGKPTTRTHDSGGYFDLTPVDRAEQIRRVIVRDLVSMGFEVEGGHHEVAPGQHEIDFRYAGALETADNLATFKFVVRNVAYRHGFLATFMPQPIFGQAGSGMHTSHSLFRQGTNSFYDPKAQWELSGVALQYIGGLLKHARGFCAVTNPLVNSYKRLVRQGRMSYFSWAPVFNSYGSNNRTNSVRVPMGGGRCESRNADGAVNPYLAATLALAAGLEGVRLKLDPGEPNEDNLYMISDAERRDRRIEFLPQTLQEAITAFAADPLVEKTLGKDLRDEFIRYKTSEWEAYHLTVSPWEIERYSHLF